MVNSSFLSSPLGSAGVRCGFGLTADALEERRPAAREAGFELVRYEAEGRVPEFDQRSAGFFLQAVLHVRDNRVRHEERSRNLEERRTLDCLHVPPEMAVVVAEVPEPAPAGSGLDRHW